MSRGSSTAAEAATPTERPDLLALLAMAVALTALGIDIMLPAFPAIRTEFGLGAEDATVSRLLTTYFLGLAVGQLAWGPVSDRLGRRRVLYAGFALYGLGALLAAVAPTLELVLGARVLWGLGAAGPRVVVLAVVRDLYVGDRMARAMSTIMAVFLLVPIVAPSLGAAIVAIAPWRWVFGVCVVAAGLVALWALRLPETLAPADRLPLRWGRLTTAVRTVVTTRSTVAHTLAMTALFAAFLGYLGTAELVIGEVFGLRRAFPAVFAALALSLGLAMVINARLVERIGTRTISAWALRSYLGVATTLVVLALLTGGLPPRWLFFTLLPLVLVAHAVLIPNLTSLAMEPLGAVAGTAAAVIGAVQVAGGALGGALLDRRFDGTVTTLTVGFLAAGLVAAAALRFAPDGAERPAEGDERPTAGPPQAA